MQKFEEEDYLNSLLKSMDGKKIESDEDKQERLIQEQIKDAVNKSNSQSSKHMDEYDDNNESNILEESAGSVNLDDSNINGASEVYKNIKDIVSEEQAASIELGEEYNDLFEPEDSNFKISDIPDREPAELTQREMDRLASMNLDGMLEDVTNESVSVDQLFGAKDSSLTANEGSPIIDKDILEAQSVASAIKAVTNGMNITADTKKLKDKNSKKKNKEKNDKKFHLAKFIKNIFFEDTEQPEEDSSQSTQNSEEPSDENERVLRELYGNNAQDKYPDENETINENQYKGDNQYIGDNDNNIEPVKKGFFANMKAKSAAKKLKAAELVKAEEEAEQAEIQRKKEVKAKKKEAAKNKKDKAKSAKAAKPKKPKKEKIKKPKKEKKPKEPTRPQDMLKIKPLSVVFLVTFVAGVVILTEILNTTLYYNNDIKNAKLYFENGNYQKAYDSIQGVNLKPTDQQLYNQITTIMYVDKQYISYQNYVKLGMGVEALDSLVKGIQRYYTYYPTAKELGVSEQLDATKAEIVSALKSTFSMSEEKAISYASLSELDYTQYYMTLESYGGLVKSDSDN